MARKPPKPPPKPGKCGTCGGGRFQYVWDGEKYVKVICSACGGTGRR